MSGRRGFSVAELVVAIAVLGVLVVALAMLSLEYIRFDRAVKMKWFVHPEVDAVLARMRTDVIESTGYPASVAGYVQGETVLILQTRGYDLKAEETVWDFSGERAVTRTRFRDGAPAESWQARNLPRFIIAAETFPDGAVAVRLQGKDEEGRIVVDQTIAPRVR